VVQIDDLDTDFIVSDVERHDIINLSPFEGFTQRTVCSNRFVSVHLELAIIDQVRKLVHSKLLTLRVGRG
jgi:hypothetical protein